MKSDASGVTPFDSRVSTSTSGANLLEITQSGTRGERPTRPCLDCGVSLALGENWTEASKNLYRYVCKTCVNARSLRWRKSNRDSTQATNRRCHIKNVSRLEEYLSSRGHQCELCVKTWPREVLDFHHPIPERKERRLGAPDWSGGSAGRAVRREADSCHLLCSNCHRLEHAALRQGESLLAAKGIVRPVGPASDTEDS